jgi:hypothetical protein
MMSILFRGAAVLAIAGAVACSRSAETAEQAGAPASLVEQETVGDSATAETAAQGQGETTNALPPTASLLPLALSVAAASLVSALVVRRVRRRVP